MIFPFLYICTACSDLESPLGEYCALITYEDFPPENVVGTGVRCVRGYPVTQDWHWIPRLQALEPYKDILISLLWECELWGSRPPSNEEQLWTQAVEQIREIRRCQRQARKEIRKRLAVHDRMFQMTASWVVLKRDCK
ncbi:hypothetical protein ACSAZL_01155 [Methanosarcina sp. T3]|uniref:hypothetical protein n=1 Tax=Methanosarcina sp. T3 TaxID=3439062 RepID=UPI003F85F349